MDLYLLSLTILPSLLILWFFVKSDKFPEPASAIIKVFIWGISKGVGCFIHACIYVQPPLRGLHLVEKADKASFTPQSPLCGL